MLFLSVVSIGEMEAGLTTLQDASRRARLEASLARHLARLFEGQHQDGAGFRGSGPKRRSDQENGG